MFLYNALLIKLISLIFSRFAMMTSNIISKFEDINKISDTLGGETSSSKPFKVAFTLGVALCTDPSVAEDTRDIFSKMQAEIDKLQGLNDVSTSCLKVNKKIEDSYTAMVKSEDKTSWAKEFKAVEREFCIFLIPFYFIITTLLQIWERNGFRSLKNVYQYLITVRSLYLKLIVCFYAYSKYKKSVETEIMDEFKRFQEDLQKIDKGIQEKIYFFHAARALPEIYSDFDTG